MGEHGCEHVPPWGNIAPGGVYCAWGVYYVLSTLCMGGKLQIVNIVRGGTLFGENITTSGVKFDREMRCTYLEHARK